MEPDPPHYFSLISKGDQKEKYTKVLQQMIDVGRSSRARPFITTSFNHVASLVRDESLITMGENCLQTASPRTHGGKSSICSMHAEMNAIRKASTNRSIKDGTAMDLIVIRVSPTGVLGMSRPCCRCIQRIQTARFKIEKIYYSTADGKIVAEKLNQLVRSPTLHMTHGDRMRCYQRETGRWDGRKAEDTGVALYRAQSLPAS